MEYPENTEALFLFPLRRQARAAAICSVNIWQSVNTYFNNLMFCLNRETFTSASLRIADGACVSG